MRAFCRDPCPSTQTSSDPDRKTRGFQGARLISKVISGVRDATHRKKADEKFRGLLESAADAMVIAKQDVVSSIDVFLPAGQRATTPVSPVGVTAPAREKTRRAYTILVVDNLPVNLDLAGSILAPSGYQVLTAGSMADGLSLARRYGCDLILSDVCMSEGSGYDFLLTVRADPRLWAIPFVLITSTMMAERDRAKGLAMGAARYLCRPMEPEVLLAEIGACLHEKRTNKRGDHLDCG